MRVQTREAALYLQQTMPLDEVVPIRLDIALDHQRFQDTFCWHSSASPEAAESFATTLCQENSLPLAVVPAILSAIQQQVETCTNSDEQALRTAERNEIVKLDVSLGSMRLHDQLVWDVNDSAADPDLFATAMCAEQSLDRAFAPLIAWHIRDQVYRYRRQARSKATLPPVNPVASEKQQAPARRTRRKSTKQAADTGFANTYSSGVVRRPDDWSHWSPQLVRADAQPSIASHPASTVHSQDNVSDVRSQTANNAAVSQLTSHSSPQFPGQLQALSQQSRPSATGQLAPSWNHQYPQQQQQQAQQPQQQEQPQQQRQLQQQALWGSQQQQQQQAAMMFLKQAQSIWEKMGLASMGIAMPQSYAEVSLIQIETVFSAESLCQADEELCGCHVQPSVLFAGLPD
ncbi:TPA: SWI SNF, matrix associated, actin dependent regulator of chromatin, subfamily b, member 1, variant 2 [Trebouxia sp. C0005]